MIMKWMKPYEGRLHKGNPLKSATKAVKKAGSQTGKTLSRAGEDLTKAGESIGAALSDPGTWMAFLVNPTLGTATGGQKSVENYEALNEADKAEARAEAEMKMAQAEEAKLLGEQKATEAKQSQMVKEREAKASKTASDRAKRLGTGRRGLLYQGKETGVNKTVLGG